MKAISKMCSAFISRFACRQGAAGRPLFGPAETGAIGKLADGLAHEIRNPLAIIIQGLECLKEGAGPADGSAKTIIKYIEDAAGRIDRITKGLVDFSHPGTPEMSPQDLNAAVREALSLMKPQLEQGHIEIREDFQGGLPQISADKNKLQQLLAILILNAIQSMTAGGILAIKTCFSGRRRIAVQIEDSGKGMPPEVLNRIFNPFFTTKRDKGCIGLGLCMARNIVAMHGGVLEIGNRPGTAGVRAAVIFRWP